MKMILRQEKVKCGHDCEECPHGPYWYGYMRPGTRLKKVYFGINKPLPWKVAQEETRLRREDGELMKKKLLAKRRTQEYSGVKSVPKRALPPSPSIGRGGKKQERKSVLDRKSFGTKSAKKTR